MDPGLLKRLREFAGPDFQDLAGATFGGEIPLTNAVINRLINERLASASGHVTAIAVEVLDDDTFSARITTRAKMIPTIRVLARIEQQPELPHQPEVGVRWSIPGMGPLGVFAGPALTFLKALPHGWRAEDDRILVDLAELLRSRGLGELLRYLSRVRVHTRRGALLVQFELRV